MSVSIILLVPGKSVAVFAGSDVKGYNANA